MNAAATDAPFDAVSVAPVRCGTPQMDALLAAMGESARASKARGENPFAAIDLARKARLGAVRIPTALGGGGATVREYFAMLIALAAEDSDLAQILRAHFWFTEERMRSANPVVRKRWLSRILAGNIIGNAMTEIGNSAPVGSFATHTQLVADGDTWRLTGTKYFCTGSLFADWVWVLASTADGTLTSVVVPTDREGVTLEDDWDGVGQRFTGSGTGHFRNVLVHEEDVVRMPLDSERSNSDRRPSDSYVIGQFVQLILTATVVGNLRSVVSRALDLARSRKRTFTHASASTTAADPQYQELIGRLAAGAAAAEALVLAAADAHQRALDSIVDGRAEFELAHAASLLIAEAKVFVDELAPRAATQLFELGGASSTMRDKALDEPWRNIVTLTAHNSTAFKARAVGDYLVNGTELPMNGYF